MSTTGFDATDTPSLEKSFTLSVADTNQIKLLQSMGTLTGNTFLNIGTGSKITDKVKTGDAIGAVVFPTSKVTPDTTKPFVTELVKYDLNGKPFPIKFSEPVDKANFDVSGI